MSRRFRPKMRVIPPEEESEDESEPKRRVSRAGARPSHGFRTSGLQIPGLPRPGKTTQGQEARRSSEPKKSFRTVRNFWRQLEGGDPEQKVHRQFGRKPPPARLSRVSTRRGTYAEPESEKKTSKTSVHRDPEPESQTKTSRTSAQLVSEPLSQTNTSKTSAQFIPEQVSQLKMSKTSAQYDPEQVHQTKTSRFSAQNALEPEIQETISKTSAQLPPEHDMQAKTSGTSAQYVRESDHQSKMSRTSAQNVPEPEAHRKSSRILAEVGEGPEVEEKRSTKRESIPQVRQSIHEEVLRQTRIPSQLMTPIQEEWVSSLPSEGASSHARDATDEQESDDWEPEPRISRRVSGAEKVSMDVVEQASGDEEEEEEDDEADEVQQLLRPPSTKPSKTSERRMSAGSRQSVSRRSGGAPSSMAPLRQTDPPLVPVSQRISSTSRRYGSLPTSQRQSGSIPRSGSLGPGLTPDDAAGDEGKPPIITVGEGNQQRSFFTPPPPAPPPPPPLPPLAFLKPPSFWPSTHTKGAKVFRRPSIVLPILLDEEKHFHEMVDAGDVEAVQDFLEKRPTFNINCSNYQGVSALLIAVKAGNEEMTLFLLGQPNLEIGDAHLYAIRDNRPIILKMILDTLQSINPSLEFMACAHSAEFAENVTPLILAAQAGHYEIIGILIERGHTISLPHHPRCFCKEECQVLLLTEDPLSVSSGKLHIYRAICNPAYICQTSSDPILTAFTLSKELLTCGQVEEIYMRQYGDLAEATRNFAVDLIAEARTFEEVQTIISEKSGIDLRGTYMYPRLILAMDLKQKEFVAHPNIQQVLEKTWLGDWVTWKGYRKYIKALYFLPRIVMLPGILIILMFMPTSSWAKYYALPINKLLSYVASYSIFLILVFIQSDVDKKSQTRDTKPTGVEVFIFIYVIAFMYNSIRSLLIEGPKRFFSFMWNLYELTMEILFILTFLFWIVAAIKTTVKKNKDEERKYWHYMDAELVAEALFVLASIMAYLKVLLICQMSYDLGPLQVSLGKMTNDCAIFSIILGIIIIAFTVGLCKFYSYYEGMEQKNPDTGESDSKQANSFTSILDTFKTLFWGLFGMSSFEVADVVIENLNDEKGQPTVINEHHFTEAIGYFVFAVYMVLTVIVILNMLIATMSNTFQKVTDNVDTEWAFGRTEVKLSYINKPVMPPPFNIIPTTKGLVDLFKGAKAKAGQITGIGIDVEKGLMEEEKKVDEFSVLMSQLVQRYFSTKSDVET